MVRTWSDQRGGGSAPNVGRRGGAARGLRVGLLLVVFWASASAARPPGGRVDAGAFDAGHVGADTCAACHPRHYQDWLKTPHARAFLVLTPVERKNPACRGCHTLSAELGFWGVQCESCHGAGRDYWPKDVMSDPKLARARGLRSGADPSRCRRCHTHDAPSLFPFVVEEALLRVSHRGIPGS